MIAKYRAKNEYEKVDSTIDTTDITSITEITNAGFLLPIDVTIKKERQKFTLM